MKVTVNRFKDTRQLRKKKYCSVLVRTPSNYKRYAARWTRDNINKYLFIFSLFAVNKELNKNMAFTIIHFINSGQDLSLNPVRNEFGFRNEIRVLQHSSENCEHNLRAGEGFSNLEKIITQKYPPMKSWKKKLMIALWWV